MDITTVLRFFEGHPVRLDEAKTFTIDDTITAVAASCLKNPFDLTSDTESAREFLAQLEKTYEDFHNLLWMQKSHLIIHSLEGLEADAVKATIAKIKYAQTLFKYQHPKLSEETPAFLKADPDFVLEAYETDHKSLEWADLALRNDPEFMRRIYIKNSLGLLFASDDLKDNDAFMLEAICYDSSAFQFASNRLKADPDFVLNAYRRTHKSLRWAHASLRNDPAFMKKIYEIDYSGLEFASDDLKDNDAFMMGAVLDDGTALKFASNRLKNDKALVIAASKYFTKAFRYASNELKDDADFMLSVITDTQHFIEHASDRLKDDEAFMIAAIAKDALVAQHASERLKNNLAFMTAAVTKDAFTINYASEALKDNDTLILTAMKNFGNVIISASARLKNEAEFMLKAMDIDASAIEQASNRLKDDEAFMTAAMQKNERALNSVSFRLKDNEAFMLVAISLYGQALYYASSRLKNNETVVIAALMKNLGQLYYASASLKDNDVFMLKAAKIHVSTLEFASERLKNNEAFMMSAVAHKGRALEYASERLKNNESLVMTAFMNAYDSLKYGSVQLRDTEAFMMKAASHDGWALRFASDRLNDHDKLVMIAIINDPTAFRFASLRLKNDPPYIVMSHPHDTMDEAFLKLVPSYGFDAEDPIIKAILNYRNLGLKRYCMAVFFLLMISCNHSKETWDEVIAPLFEKKQWAILPLMVMAFIDLPKERGILPLPPSLDLKLLPHLFRSSINLAKEEDHFILPKEIDEFLKVHKESFKDARSGTLNTLLTLLHTLNIASLGTGYLQHCFVLDNLEESLSRMKMLTILLKKRSHAHIEALRDFSSRALLHDLLTEFIHEGLINEGSQEAFKRTFFSSRHPEAIFTYASLFLHDEDMKLSLKNFIDMVIKGDFKAGRDEANSHKHRLTAEQKRIWEAGAHSEARYEPIHERFNPKQFLVAKLITDDHAPGAFSYLKSHLTDSPSMGAATEVEALSLQLMESPTLEEQLMLLRQLKEKLVGGGQFLRDIEDQIKLLERREKARDVTLYDSDNWQDLFYLGTEVLGSCQHIDADASTNKCLLGYALDGKTRVICAKNRGDEGGPINARAIIKILITAEGKPALFLERVYPPGNPAMDILIKNFALQRAHALGMDLYEAGEGTTLASERCAAPWEYEDAKLGGAEAAVTTGTYTISAKRVS